MAHYQGKNYKLRTSNPMPTSTRGHFVLHTFMAALQDSDIETCTDELPSSSDFVGQGGNLTSANFSRLPIGGGGLFQGKTSDVETYDEEGVWGFN